MSNGRPRNRNFLATCTLIAFSGLFILRQPNLLISPRFWAEEGKIFFQFAYNHDPFEALRFVWWESGYLNFIVNLATTFAAHVTPLLYAPFVPTYTALVIQVIPAVIVLFGKSVVFDGIPKKIIACAILLFSPAQCGEVWLNTLNSQVYFGLIAVLILTEETEKISLIWRWFYRLLLAVGGLSGVYVAFLWAIFACKAFIERQKERYVQLGIVTFVLFVQAGIYIVSILSRKSFEIRTVHSGWRSLADVSFSRIGIPFFGGELAGKLSMLSGPVGHHLFIALFAILLCVMFYRNPKRALDFRDSGTVLLWSFIVLTIAISLTGFGGGIGSRYAVLPGFILLFLTLDSVNLSQRPFLSITLIVLIFLPLSFGAHGYRHDPAFSCDGAFPNMWKTEVELWRLDPSHAIQICPRWEIWEMRLQPRAGDKPLPESYAKH